MVDNAGHEFVEHFGNDAVKLLRKVDTADVDAGKQKQHKHDHREKGHEQEKPRVCGVDRHIVLRALIHEFPDKAKSFS